MKKVSLQTEIWEIQAILYLIAGIFLLKICESSLAHFFGWCFAGHSIVTLVRVLFRQMDSK